MNETIAYALQNSPFYQKHLGGYQKEKLTSLEDVALLPFTSPQDLREKSLQMLCVSQSEIARIVTLDSSGTTGQPKRIFFTKDDQELTRDFFLQGMNLLTFSGERVLIMLPCQRPGSIGDLLYTALERLGTVPIKHGLVESLAETLTQISATGAEVLVGVPKEILAVAKYYQFQGEKPPVKLKRILLSTDYVSSAVVKELKRIWDCEVYRYYGMTEMGLGGGIECQNHVGYHLYQGDFFFEIVDPLTGKVLPTGQWGEVVFTTLTRKGMPLIRYRTGDISRFLPGTCPCGSVLVRLDNIRGRKKGVIILDRECSFSRADLEDILLSIPAVIDFSAEVFSQGEGNVLKLQIDTWDTGIEIAALQAVLKKNNALRQGQEKGKLKIYIQLRKVSANYRPAKGKGIIKKVGS